MSMDWQLPSLHFKPLSFLRSQDEMRPSPKSHSRPSIISPTPKRPVSSQSRRRFSKILEVDSPYCFDGKPLDLTRSYDSLNSLKLKRVLNADTGYAHKYSIPPFLPRHSTIMEPSRENESSEPERDKCDKSTVESLLDKHIECLGLQIGSTEGDSTDPSHNASTIKMRDTSTLNTAETSDQPASSLKTQNDSSNQQAKTQGVRQSTARLKTVESAPCLTLSEPSRPSYGWNTLNSVSNLSSIGLIQSPPLTNHPEENGLCRRTLSHASPRSSCISITSDELYNWDDDPSSMRKGRSKEFARQVSQRRKMRIRLKMKRNSHNQSPHSPQSSLDEAPLFQSLAAPLVGENDAKGEPQSAHATKPEAPRSEAAPRTESPVWPVIPKRLSSNPPIQTVKRSVDLARKISITTIRSHHSHISVVEPMNSSRMWATAPHISIPDLGPSLNSMSLNMNFVFPQAPTPPAQRRKATLPPTQSFFSDNSSAVHNPRASLRKKLHLPNLRGKIPLPHPSKSSLHLPLVNGNQEPKPGPAVHFKAQREHSMGNINTVGLSEFAYRKKKLVERVKGWWNRQCVQRKRVKQRQAAS